MAPSTITAPVASYQPNQQNAKPHYPYITSSQPTSQRGMVMAPPSEEEREAERLRGGCIPLPNTLMTDMNEWIRDYTVP
ncbi:unnamed protein product [Rhizoctonia solani]|nr:unnamed protein product [Rhizoctonia solani]